MLLILGEYSWINLVVYTIKYVVSKTVNMRVLTEKNTNKNLDKYFLY